MTPHTTADVKANAVKAVFSVKYAATPVTHATARARNMSIV